MAPNQSKEVDGQCQYLVVMKAMRALVSQSFNPGYMLTPEGHALVSAYAIKAAHPELPCVLHLLAMMRALRNGATTTWFPNQKIQIKSFY